MSLGLLWAGELNVRHGILEERRRGSVTSTKSKLEKHYEQLGRVSVDSDFDLEWKKIVERKVGMCSSLSGVCGDETGNREGRNCEVYLKAKK